MGCCDSSEKNKSLPRKLRGGLIDTEKSKSERSSQAGVMTMSLQESKQESTQDPSEATGGQNTKQLALELDQGSSTKSDSNKVTPPIAKDDHSPTPFAKDKNSDASGHDATTPTVDDESKEDEGDKGNEKAAEKESQQVDRRDTIPNQAPISEGFEEK